MFGETDGLNKPRVRSDTKQEEKYPSIKVSNVALNLSGEPVMIENMFYGFNLQSKKKTQGAREPILKTWRKAQVLTLP